MGKEGADQIVQIAEDLIKAQEAIKRIPAKEMGAWEKYLPLASFIPGGKAISGAKAFDYVRRGYGYFLTTPEKRNLFDRMLKSFIKGDKEAFLKAEESLLSSTFEI